MPIDSPLPTAAARPVAPPGPPADHPRWQAVLAHIDAHLDAPLRVAQLARVAGWSPFHFHRQFVARFGLGVHALVQLARLRRAAQQLAHRPAERVTDIALTSGFESAQTFARAFKARIGQTPTAFRRAPDWAALHAATAPLTDFRTTHMPPLHAATDVRIVTREATPVALLEHRGDPAGLHETVRSFIAWRRAVRLPPARSATYNVVHDDPDAVPPEDFRFGLCAATDAPIAANPQGVVAATLAGGRYAVLRHTGSDETLAASVRHLYGQWLPASGEAPRDAPLLLQRVRFFPDVPAHAAVTDVLLPLR